MAKKHTKLGRLRGFFIVFHHILRIKGRGSKFLKNLRTSFTYGPKRGERGAMAIAHARAPLACSHFYDSVSENGGRTDGWSANSARRSPSPLKGSIWLRGDGFQRSYEYVRGSSQNS